MVDTQYHFFNSARTRTIRINARENSEIKRFVTLDACRSYRGSGNRRPASGIEGYAEIGASLEHTTGRSRAGDIKQV